MNAPLMAPTIQKPSWNQMEKLCSWKRGAAFTSSPPPELVLEDHSVTLGHFPQTFDRGNRRRDSYSYSFLYKLYTNTEVLTKAPHWPITTPTLVVNPIRVLHVSLSLGIQLYTETTSHVRMHVYFYMWSCLCVFFYLKKNGDFMGSELEQRQVISIKNHGKENDPTDSGE